MTKIDNRLHYIYKITNLINNKIYIGQTVDIRVRWNQHKAQAKQEQPSMIINQAMKKYGIDNFIIEVIDFAFSYAQADCIENCLIDYLQSHISFDKGYNVSLGGSTAPKSDEWKQHMSEIMMGNTNGSGSFPKGLLPWNLGVPMTDEIKQKVSEACKGIPKPRTAEHQAKLTATQIGKKRSEETKKKLSDAWDYDKHITPEFIVKQSENSQKFWDNNTALKEEFSMKYKNKTWKLVDGKRIWMDK